MNLPYAKMSGAGNLFVVIDGRELPEGLDSAHLAQYVCSSDGPAGGADGLIVIDDSFAGNFEMLYWNRDGSTGMMCGNGARCAVRMAGNLGRINDRENVIFRSAGREYRASLGDDDIRVEFANDATVELNRSVRVHDVDVAVHFVELGSPHFVLFVDELRDGAIDDVDVENLGRAIRASAEAGTGGLNVNFVSVTDSAAIRLRTYERGVEEETGACGTGAIASGIVSHLVRGTDHPTTVVPSSGSPLLVDFRIASDSDGNARRVSNLTLSGNAEIIEEGRFELPASVNG